MSITDNKFININSGKLLNQENCFEQERQILKKSIFKLVNLVITKSF